MWPEIATKTEAQLRADLAETPVSLRRLNQSLFLVSYAQHDAVAEFAFERGEWCMHYRAAFEKLTDADKDAFRAATTLPIKDYIAIWQITKRLTSTTP